MGTSSSVHGRSLHLYPCAFDCADAESTYKLFAPAAEALAAVLQRMQLCFYGTLATEDAARQADSIIHHLQQDLVGNLCTILQAVHSTEGQPSQRGMDATVSALKVCERLCVSVCCAARQGG